MSAMRSGRASVARRNIRKSEILGRNLVLPRGPSGAAYETGNGFGQGFWLVFRGEAERVGNDFNMSLLERSCVALGVGEREEIVVSGASEQHVAVETLAQHAPRVLNKYLGCRRHRLLGVGQDGVVLQDRQAVGIGGLIGKRSL